MTLLNLIANVVVVDHSCLVRVIFAKRFELHLRKVKGRHDRVIEFKPGLLVSLHPLRFVISRVVLAINIDIGDVVTCISNAHVNHHTNQFVVKLLISELLALFDELLKLLLLLFTPLSVFVIFFLLGSLLVRVASDFLLIFLSLILIASRLDVKCLLVFFLEVLQHLVEHELPDVELIGEL